jgi:hypothetical protein
MSMKRFRPLEILVALGLHRRVGRPPLRLYAFRPFLAHSRRGTGTLPHLNKRLREIADKVTCALPIDRNDEETKKACGLH